mmetsp:Transcript_1535/g.4914  ORF Transcript_1535/g.4914 Transcript_1535/m.4914 type:complete len:208 (-) Transcript_1535:273-896(-)
MAQHVLEVARGAAPDRQPRGGAPLPRQPEPHQPLAPRQQRLAEAVVAGTLLAVKGGDVLARAQSVAGELEANGGVVDERVGGGVAGAHAEEAAEATRLRRVRDGGGVGRVRTGDPLAQVPADAVLLRDEGRPQLREHRRVDRHAKGAPKEAPCRRHVRQQRRQLLRDLLVAHPVHRVEERGHREVVAARRSGGEGAVVKGDAVSGGA